MWQELLSSPTRSPAALPQDISSLSSLTTPGKAQSSAWRHRLPAGSPATPSGGFHHPLGSCLSCSVGCHSCSLSCHQRVPSSVRCQPHWLSPHLPQPNPHSPSRRCSQGSPRCFMLPCHRHQALLSAAWQIRKRGAAPSGPNTLRLLAPPRKGRVPRRSSPPAALQPRKGSCCRARKGKKEKAVNALLE